MHKDTNMWGKEKAPQADFEMACSIADSPSLLQGGIAHMQFAKECHWALSLWCHKNSPQEKWAYVCWQAGLGLLETHGVLG
jgi:hypothetical protein